MQDKERDAGQLCKEQIQYLKDQIERKNYFINLKGKSFNNLYTFTVSMIPPNDFTKKAALQQIVRQKNNQE